MEGTVPEDKIDIAFIWITIFALGVILILQNIEHHNRISKAIKEKPTKIVYVFNDGMGDPIRYEEER